MFSKIMVSLVVTVISLKMYLGSEPYGESKYSRFDWSNTTNRVGLSILLVSLVIVTFYPRKPKE